MTITIIATPGASNANSYVTLAEANSYLETSLQASTWAALDDEVKKAALVAATRQLNTLKYAGRRETQSQSLAWPRIGLYDYDSYVVSGVPTNLKSATNELAIWNLTEEDRLAGTFELENMESVTIGPITYKVGASAESFPSYVEDLLEAIGPYILQEDSSAGIMVL